MKAEQALKERFHCPKCRSRACRVTHVALSQSRLPVPTMSFLAAICTLCGYSEFYAQEVVESVRDAAEITVPNPIADTAPEG